MTHSMNVKMNLQEQILRIQEMMGTINESNFFERRVDLENFKQQLSFGVPYIFHDTNSLEEFKYSLLQTTLSNYIFYKFKIEISNLPNNVVDTFIEKLYDQFNDIITKYYYNIKENGRLINTDGSNINLNEEMEDTNNKIRNYLFRRITMSEFNKIVDSNYDFAEKEYDPGYTLDDFHSGVVNIIIEDLHNFDYVDVNEFSELYYGLRNYLGKLLKERSRKSFISASEN